MGAASLKSKNFTWLVGILAFDVLCIVAAATQATFGDLANAKSLALRASLITLLPVPALLLSLLLPSNLKASLVFWRSQDPLPGARAFTVHAPADPRIALDRLRKNVGDFPEAPAEQNSRWYGLYRDVQNEPSVADSHRNYLLFRDLAAVSLLLAIGLPVILLMLGHTRTLAGMAAAAFLIQYAVAVQVGRVSGVRMVRNVLAIHADLKPATRARTTKAKE